MVYWRTWRAPMAGLATAAGALGGAAVFAGSAALP